MEKKLLIILIVLVSVLFTALLIFATFYFDIDISQYRFVEPVYPRRLEPVAPILPVKPLIL